MEREVERKIKEPFLRVAKRGNIATSKKGFLTLSGIGVALLLGAIFLAAMGVPAFKFYGEMIRVSFKDMRSFTSLIRELIPLAITSVGISVAFKMKYWNIGAQGQFMMGAIISTSMGMFLYDKLPHIVLIFLMILCGTIGGGIFGLIPAFFKVKFNTNETLLTLMFNYIAFYIVEYLKKVDGFYARWRGTIQPLPNAARLTPVASMGNIDIALVFCILIAILIYIYMRYTKHGYEISVIGDSLPTAKYAGINTNWVIVRTAFLSAAIIALAGVLYVSGYTANYTLTSAVGNYGWTGITIAWLSRLNPLSILFVSFLFSILSRGGDMAKTRFNLSGNISNILQGLILFGVLAFDFFTNYTLIMGDNAFKRKVIVPIRKFFEKIYSQINNFFSKIFEKRPKKDKEEDRQ